MATAKRVTNWDRTNVAWVEIEDDANVKYLYEKGDHAPDARIVHVDSGHATDGRQFLELVRENGETVLGQSDLGLPSKIIVNWYDESDQPLGAPFNVGFGCRYEFNLKTNER